MKAFLAIAFLFFALGSPVMAEEPSEQESILAVIDKFFTAQKDRDPEVWKEIMVMEGTIMSHRERPGDTWVLNKRTVTGDIGRLTKGDVVIDETIYDPTVLVHKTIATVWAPYDIYVGERLLHCGIDVFQLFKVEGQWKIAHFSYTTEPEGCEGLGLPPGE